MTLSLIAAAVTTLLFLFMAFVNGWFANSDLSSGSLIFFIGLCAAISALTFLVTVVMFEFWWRRHPPAWLDTDDGSGHEADDRG